MRMAITIVEINSVLFLDIANSPCSQKLILICRRVKSKLVTTWLGYIRCRQSGIGKVTDCVLAISTMPRSCILLRPSFCNDGEPRQKVPASQLVGTMTASGKSALVTGTVETPDEHQGTKPALALAAPS